MTDHRKKDSCGQCHGKGWVQGPTCAVDCPTCSPPECEHDINALTAERDALRAEVERLRVPGALETGRNGGWQEMIETMREQNRRTNRAMTEARARVAELEAVIPLARMFCVADHERGCACDACLLTDAVIKADKGAALSPAPPAKTGPACEKCRGYGMQWRSGVLVDCECHFPRVDAPPAKPSVVDEALAAWRGLSEEQREIMRERVSRRSAFDGQSEIGAERAALALLRASACSACNTPMGSVCSRHKP